MGATKFELFENDICELSTLLKSISHPARLKAILLIADSPNGELDTEKIIEEVGLSQSTISYHLKFLKDVGLINTKICRFRNSFIQVYRLNHIAVKKIVNFLELLLKKMEMSYDPQYCLITKFYSKFRDFNFNSSILQV